MVDEDLAGRVRRAVPEGLSRRHRAAIALADAMMTRPDSLADADVAALAEELSRDEIVEATIDVMKWNAQKAAVALRVDDEVRPGELTDLVFDEDGNWVRPA